MHWTILSEHVVFLSTSIMRFANLPSDMISLRRVGILF